ncbi:tRNA (adenosine(37)-N6)-threonylcarbamoyltransferase complex ATPase subunit type 1 TsaE [Cytophagaceae bacterium ABcell3]|nr:tRNA (adenosine(37)-N6)-threonylcarbamoyltransferase complex ATPase subunit type 1 TsaE [Cytophagaceae bacterium ABcell3]
MTNQSVSFEAINNDLDKLSETAKELITYAEGKNIWLFEGEMAAGKTTFIKAICKVKGVTDNVTSPTFSLVNEYQTKEGDTIYHFDFYRIKDESEALDIGCEEYFYSGNLCLIEWPSMIPSLIPDNYLKIHITAEKEQRKIQAWHYEN